MKNYHITHCPYAAQLSNLPDDVAIRVVEVEAEREGATVASIRKTPLSGQVMKLIYGNDGTIINNESVDRKLQAWSKEYLAKKLLPHKSEPMLYFLDMCNGKGYWSG